MLWSREPAAAYDLVAGTLLARGAGGDVTDIEGRPIDSLRPAGPFVAAIDARARGAVADLARAALSEESHADDA